MRFRNVFAVALLSLAVFACDGGGQNTPTAPGTPRLSTRPTASPASEKTVDKIGTSDVTDKTGKIAEPGLLTAVRAAGHDGFDRLVFEFAGPALPGYRIEYLERPATQCGSGEAVSLLGNARLAVRFRPANAHTEKGEATIAERDMLPALVTLKQLRAVCDFEADVEWVAGMSEAKPYRVLELKDPTRLVIDIDH